MGLFDRSSSRTTANNTYNTTTLTQQTDQSGNEGLNFSNVGGGLSLTENSNYSDTRNTTTNYLDGGAIEAGTSLGKRAIDATVQANADSIGFLSDSLDAVSRVNADSIDLLSGLVSGALDNSKTLARDAMSSNSQSVKDAIAGFSSLAQQNSASSDDRLLTVVMYAIAGIAAIIVLPKLFGGARSSSVIA